MPIHLRRFYIRQISKFVEEHNNKMQEDRPSTNKVNRPVFNRK